jgi:small subunit ribosomal protein S5
MSSNDRNRNREESDDGFIEKLVAVNRVSKTVKGVASSPSPR